MEAGASMLEMPILAGFRSDSAPDAFARSSAPLMGSVGCLDWNWDGRDDLGAGPGIGSERDLVSSWRGEEAERGERKRKNREIRQVRCLFNFFLGFPGTVSRCLYTSTASSRSYLGYHSITRPDHLTHCGPITLEFGFLWRFSIFGLPSCFFSSALLFLASTVCLLWLLLTFPPPSDTACPQAGASGN
jgi:hypothetical protein